MISKLSATNDTTGPSDELPRRFQAEVYAQMHYISHYYLILAETAGQAGRLTGCVPVETVTGPGKGYQA
jgi:hypothetical protein